MAARALVVVAPGGAGVAMEMVPMARAPAAVALAALEWAEAARGAEAVARAVVTRAVVPTDLVVAAWAATARRVKAGTEVEEN